MDKIHVGRNQGWQDYIAALKATQRHNEQVITTQEQNLEVALFCGEVNREILTRMTY